MVTAGRAGQAQTPRACGVAGWRRGTRPAPHAHSHRPPLARLTGVLPFMQGEHSDLGWRRTSPGLSPRSPRPPDGVLPGFPTLLQKEVEEPPPQELLADDVSLLADALSPTLRGPSARAKAVGRGRSGLLRPRGGPALSPGNSEAGNTSSRGPAVGSAPGGGGAGQGCDSLWGKVDLRLKCRGGRGLQPRSGQCCFEESGSDWVTVW